MPSTFPIANLALRALPGYLQALTRYLHASPRHPQASAAPTGPGF